LLFAERGLKGTFSLFAVERAGSTEGELEQFFAHVAQSVEHILGKDEVTSSNLVMGSSFEEILAPYKARN
jgi:hypothetical protein